MAGVDTRRVSKKGKLIGGHGYNGTMTKNYKLVLKTTAKKVARQLARNEERILLPIT